MNLLISVNKKKLMVMVEMKKKLTLIVLEIY